MQALNAAGIVGQDRKLYLEDDATMAAVPVGSRYIPIPGAVAVPIEVDTTRDQLEAILSGPQRNSMNYIVMFTAGSAPDVVQQLRGLSLVENSASRPLLDIVNKAERCPAIKFGIFFDNALIGRDFAINAFVKHIQRIPGDASDKPNRVA